MSRDSERACPQPVRFRCCDAQTPIEVRLASDERLLDVIDALGLAVPFGCRAGTCGTCRIRIESGGDQLALPDAAELRELDLYEGDNLRLACCVRGAATTSK